MLTDSLFHFIAQQEPSGTSTMVDKIARTPLSQIIMLAVVCTVLRFAMMPILERTPLHKRLGGYRTLNFANGLLDAIIYAGVLIFFVVRPFLFQAFQIPTGSMLETIQLNDLIGGNKAVYRFSDPKPGDIVIFRPPAHGCFENQLDEKGEPKVDFIKRCLGGPGDLVELKGDTLYRNGKVVPEPYKREPMQTEWKLVKYKGQYYPCHMQGGYTNSAPNLAAPKFGVTMDEMDALRSLPAERIPPGHYLMIGDNRNGSYDGRFWGLVTREQIVGRCDFVWWPISRWRLFR